MSRSYRQVRAKKNRVYSVEGVMALYGVCRNTVSNWVVRGLRPSDAAQPQIFRGAELIRFHKTRQSAPSKLSPNTFFCLGCKSPALPAPGSLRLEPQEHGKLLAQARCPDCGSALRKILGETVCDRLHARVESNTSPGWKDEEKAEIPACIGKIHPDFAMEFPTLNDRTLHLWQQYAGRYDPKTVEAHLSSIRDFECFNAGSPFAEVTKEQAAAWRDGLVAQDGKGFARSTLRHRASHLRAFFDWLAKQPGHHRLLPVSAYFDLPRKFYQAPAPKVRSWPEMEEAAAMLEAMPTDTLKDRRARAIFVFAFVAGFRADALITTRLRHVDPVTRTVRHDGVEMRAKNGKSFSVDWFPRTEPFRAVFVVWLEEVIALGLRPDDALFADLNDLAQAAEPGRTPIEPMRSSAAVTEAFRIASRGASHAYSPHSARHALTHLGDTLCRTAAERKA